VVVQLGFAVVTGDSPIGSGSEHRLTEEPPMTDEMRALIEKSPEADLLRELIGFAGRRLIGAGGRGQPRTCAQCNACRDHT